MTYFINLIYLMPKTGRFSYPLHNLKYFSAGVRHGSWLLSMPGDWLRGDQMSMKVREKPRPSLYCTERNACQVKGQHVSALRSMMALIR